MSTVRGVVPIVGVALMAVGASLVYLAQRYIARKLFGTAVPPATRKAETLAVSGVSATNLFICTTCCVGKRATAEVPNKLPTGQDLLCAVVERLRDTSKVDAAVVDIEKIHEYVTERGSEVRIVPQKCLGACKQSNCIAFSHPYKYQYHFGMLDAQAADVEDIISFAKYYADEEGVAFTKKADRPGKLATNCISRLPPPISTAAKVT